MVARNTGQISSNGANKPFLIASVVKLFIADDLLLQESERNPRSPLIVEMQRRLAGHAWYFDNISACRVILST